MNVRKTENPIKKASRRFKPIPYHTNYLPQESEEFRTAITKVYESVFRDYLVQRKEGTFAKCCWTFGRRKLKDKLAHPVEYIEKVSDIIKDNAIKTVEDVEIYLKKTLPKDENGHFFKPTVNRIHSLLTVNAEPLLMMQNEPIDDTSLQIRPNESDIIESSIHLTFEASNQFKPEHFEQENQFESESEGIHQLTIYELTRKLKEKDEVIEKMVNDKMNLEEENRCLKNQNEDNEALLLSRISSLELDCKYLATNYRQKRPPEVNSFLSLEKKKPEVKSFQDLSKKIDRLVKNSKMSFGGFDLKR